MDFADTADEARFRAEARAWLSANAQEYAKPPATPWREEDLVSRAKAWQRRKAEAGFAGITLPRDIGGHGGTPMEALIFAEEEGHYHIPTGPFLHVGVAMTVPALLAHAGPAHIQELARPTLRGEILWCQLYSEPGAGSDLAGIRTRAVRNGDHWVLNGQKVWSSWAHHAQRGILLCRTDPAVSKHKGLSFFLLDMKTPGIEMRPIRQITGGAEFNEVFFTDVMIPDSARVGAPGDGWRIAMTTLMSERLIGDEAGDSISFDDVFALAQRPGPSGAASIEDGAVREKLANWYARGQGLSYFRYRLMTLMSKGGVPGAEAAIAKLAFATRVQEMAAFAMDLDDAAGVFAGDMNPVQRRSFDAYMFAVNMRIAGGTDEILRNQIGERLLGLPAEPRVDKDIPFQSLVG